MSDRIRHIVYGVNSCNDVILNPVLWVPPLCLINILMSAFEMPGTAHRPNEVGWVAITNEKSGVGRAGIVAWAPL